jgi:cellulose synthase/poly-beta-1,6-N-acetylglucosamine synthase-like glycosyltransferase
MRAVLIVARFVAAWTAACSTYLVALLAMALRGPSRPQSAKGPQLRITVLVPAHNEANGIAETVGALVTQAYPGSLRRVVVIADNCTDSTASIARSAGAEVWERTDPARPGKGQALAWALERVWLEPNAPDAIVMVDADCIATGNLLSALGDRLRAGAPVVQADYRVANPEESSAAARRFAGFALMHGVRGAGKSAAGISCGLFGTGMGFAARVLHEHPWTSFSLTEDAEYHVRLIEAGRVAEFAPECAVQSRMPLTESDAHEQQMRWESGKAELARRTVPRLLVMGIRRRDLQRLHAAWEQIVPPQSILIAAAVGSGAVGLAARDRRTSFLAVVAVVLQALFVLAGLAAMSAPAVVWRALLTAPALVMRKARQAVLVWTGRGSKEWVRTQRVTDH